MLGRPKKGVVEGRFIGNTSSGFVTGQIYRIKLMSSNKYLWAFDTSSSAKCPYSSINTFAENWEIPVQKYPKSIILPVGNI